MVYIICKDVEKEGFLQDGAHLLLPHELRE